MRSLKLTTQAAVEKDARNKQYISMSQFPELMMTQFTEVYIFITRAPKAK